MSNEYKDWLFDEEQEFPGSLHNHTDYSNLKFRDSINTVPGIIDYAIELGHKCIAITEHDCISSSIVAEDYYDKIKEKYPDFKIILGNEIYLVRNDLTADNFVVGKDKYYHFILLAKDAIGHQQIRELSTRAWLRSYVSRNQRRVPTYYRDLEEIISVNPGHVIASTSCLGSYLSTNLLEYHINKNEELYQKIIKWCNYIISIFGKDNFYLEMQPSAYNEQEYVNLEILELSKKLNIPYIITTDSHYMKKEDAPIHEAYLNSQDGDREVKSFYATTYMMDTQELESYMNGYLTKEDFRKAYYNILEIRDKCEVYSLKKPLKIPQLRWKIPEVEVIEDKWFAAIPNLRKFYESDCEGDNILARAIVQAIKKSPEELENEKTFAAIDDCLDKTWESSIVNKAHWSYYFLNLQNIVEECWNAGTIVGAGRGSGVGFILLYLLDIIQINALRENTQTFSFRFLNPARVSVLDIDTDIEGGRRQQVLQHLRNVYGEDRVANVITFKTEKSKSAIQTVCRGMNVDIDDARYLSSLIPEERGATYTLSQAFYGDKENGIKSSPMFVKEMTENFPEVWKMAQKIEGLICGYGVHAGGVIFVDEPFANSTALMKAPDGTVITQFDLHKAEEVSQN